VAPAKSPIKTGRYNYYHGHDDTVRVLQRTTKGSPLTLAIDHATFYAMILQHESESFFVALCAQGFNPVIVVISTTHAVQVCRLRERNAH